MRQSELTGKRITIIRMEDPYTDLRPGSKGTIKGEDDMGHILECSLLYKCTDKC